MFLPVEKKSYICPEGRAWCHFIVIEEGSSPWEHECVFKVWLQYTCFSQTTEICVQFCWFGLTAVQRQCYIWWEQWTIIVTITTEDNYSMHITVRPCVLLMLWSSEDASLFSCVEKRIQLIHTTRIVSTRGIAIALVKCWKIKVLSLRIVFPWISFMPCKHCKATGSCLYLPSVKNKAAENTNWPQRATFVLNWFHRYAQLQLYGSLVDLVLTALLSLATSNKHLAGLENLCYASQKSFHTLKLFKVNL